MTSLIGGIQNSLVNSLGLNAARMVQIYSSQELTDSDVQKLQKLVPQIEQIGIVDSAYTEYKTGDKSYTVMAQGVDSDMLDAVGASKLVAGRTYSQAESQSGSRYAVVLIILGVRAVDNSDPAATPWARSRCICHAKPSPAYLATRILHSPA